jgi:AP-1 complex subunit mu
VPGACIERFMPIVLDIEEEGQQLTPCFTREGVNYIHIRHSNLYRAPTFPRPAHGARAHG